MTERALVRTAPQVRALLAGATLIRVPVVPQPRPHSHDGCRHIGLVPMADGAWMWECACGWDQATRCQLGVVGDHLWCRETWRHGGGEDGGARTLGRACVYYRADEGWNEGAGWRPSTHMPREYARLVLEVVEVRAQKLGEVTPRDALDEGVTGRPRCYGYQGQDDDWSMDWSRVGTPSRYAGGKPALTEADIALGSPVSALGNAWNAQYEKRGLPWSPGLWTFAVRVKVSP